ncbi:MAG: response regulator transcription factor [Chitinophagales bacterium]|mgnify:FL=1|jgi:two-component system, OmpR family, alkaline phosphatase synthesis response regulator PhoP|tara:strand:- start:13135 stop:13815 length:681 start_codon:yes stop_codon:yes gene_type:complete
MNNSRIKILLVDDEEDTLEFINYNLQQEGFQTACASDGVEAIELAKIFQPNLIVLDVMMPIMDGVEVCSELRKLPELKQTIITFLTARHEDYSQIAGFDAGADDYISKPIKPKLLISKIHSLLRRLQEEEIKNYIEAGGLKIDLIQHLVFTQDKELSLPKKEFNLLCLLMSKPGRVFTREEILTKVWGTETIVVDRTIDVHIRKLREKIGNDFFVTLKGVGYKFQA